MQRILRLGLTALAGVFSVMLLGWGLYLTASIDFRPNPLLTFFYCILPILSLPTFFLALVFRRVAMVQAIFALAWLPVYTALNWRSCAALGLCGSIGATVLMTLKTRMMMAYFASAVCLVVATQMRAREQRGR